MSTPKKTEKTENFYKYGLDMNKTVITDLSVITEWLIKTCGKEYKVISKFNTDRNAWQGMIQFDGKKTSLSFFPKKIIALDNALKNIAMINGKTIDVVGTGD
jgi:hypothetical protein